jgi:hypothetical protein
MDDTNEQKPLSKTYSEMAVEWCAEQDWRVGADETMYKPIDILSKFAKYLDSMPYLFPHLELLVIKQARKVDREFLTAMMDEIGIDKAKEIAKSLAKKHIHSIEGKQQSVIDSSNLL